MFDWLSFLRMYSIEYVDEGPNVARGNVNIQCPFCGTADQSHHMGISLDGKGWGCWRSVRHRGKSPIRLIMALLRCDYDRAKEIVGTPQRDLSDLEKLIATREGPYEIEEFQQIDNLGHTLSFPREFEAIKQTPLRKKFCNYLRGRGFDEPEELTEMYGIRVARKGAFSNRIIFPVFLDGALITWTGRALSSNAVVRYKTLSSNPEKAVDGMYAVSSIKKCVWNYDELMQGGEALFIVEGPFDSLKVDYYGQEVGIRATCLFGVSMSSYQWGFLQDLCPRFAHTFVMFDDAAYWNALSIREGLSNYDVRIATTPAGVEDPGGLKRRQVLQLI